VLLAAASYGDFPVRVPLLTPPFMTHTAHSILSAFLQECFPNSGPLSAMLDSVPPEMASSTRLHRLLLAYYRILMANPNLPTLFDWPLEPLSRLFWEPHPDPGVRYLAIRCYALQSRMSEVEREKLEKSLIGSMDHAECPLEFGINVHGRVNIIDGWLLPVVETQRIHDARNAIAADTSDFSMGEGGNSIQLSDLRCVSSANFDMI
jgi:midasin